jgi:ubiquinone/menaquinone biosynthesis C-methylase UbiE
MSDNYIEVNKALWDKKTVYHVDSAFYAVDDFINGKSSLNDIELGLLGDVKGKSVLHLQCHFGQDTLSLARMGAKATGVDFSEVAIDKARELNEQLQLDATFICSDIYELPAVLDTKFDIVFTSYGTIGWLPDMQRWAQVVARYLKPGGQFVFVDFHPVVWMFNNEFSDFQFSYFNRGAIIETQQGTYADTNAAIAAEEIGWNHSLSEVFQNLIEAGLQIRSFNEVDYSPYNCFSKMVEVAPGKFQISGLEGKIPMLYALDAVRQ